MKKKTIFFDKRITKDKKELKLINGTLIPLGEDNIAYLIETFLDSIDKNLLDFYHKQKTFSCRVLEIIFL